MAIEDQSQPSGAVSRRSALRLAGGAGTAGVIALTPRAYANAQKYPATAVPNVIRVAAIQLRPLVSIGENLARMCRAIDHTQSVGAPKHLVCFGAAALDGGEIVEIRNEPFAPLAAKANQYRCDLVFSARFGPSRDTARSAILIGPSGRMSIGSDGAAGNQSIIVGRDDGRIQVCMPQPGATAEECVSFDGLAAAVRVTTVDARVTETQILGSVIYGPAGDVRAAASAAWEQVVVAEIPVSPLHHMS